MPGAIGLLEVRLGCGRTVAACSDFLESPRGARPAWRRSSPPSCLSAPTTAASSSASAPARFGPKGCQFHRQEQLEVVLSEDDDAPLLAIGADGCSNTLKTEEVQ